MSNTTPPAGKPRAIRKDRSAPTVATVLTAARAPIDSVLSRLDKVRSAGTGKWTACCPSHDDKTPSLSVGEAHDGTVLLKCFAGCESSDVISALGLTAADLFPTEQRRTSNKTSPPRPAKAAPVPKPAPAPAMPSSAALAIWNRAATPATAQHAYCQKKGISDGPALAGLRVLAENDTMVLDGIKMAGALVIPLYRPDGTFQAVQCISPAGEKRTRGTMENAFYVVGQTGGRPARLCLRRLRQCVGVLG